MINFEINFILSFSGCFMEVYELSFDGVDVGYTQLIDCSNIKVKSR